MRGIESTHGVVLPVPPLTGIALPQWARLEEGTRATTQGHASKLNAGRECPHIKKVLHSKSMHATSSSSFTRLQQNSFSH